MLFNLSHFGLLKISGNDAGKLLQGQLTCDIAKLQPGTSCMAAHCNPKGRVVSLFFLTQTQDAYYLLMHSSMINLTIAAFKKYAIFFKVELSDITQNVMIIGETTHSPTTDSEYLLKEPDTIIFNTLCKITNDSSLKIIVLDRSNESKLLTEPNNSINLWHYFNIKKYIPTLCPHTSGKFLPHELNLDNLNAIDLNKGCYTGQEVIARIHYRGSPKTKMYYAEVNSHEKPLPGVDIFSLKNGKPYADGAIVDMCSKENDLYCLLIVTDKIDIENKHLFLTQGMTKQWLTLPHIGCSE